MTVETVVRDYYDALRSGRPLAPYFGDDAVVKFGVNESLYGADVIVDGLREQRETTDEWRVESERLVVDERGAFAVFADEVQLAWTDADGERRRFDTR
ncbi:hypothetical protein [Halovivax sp.]|uniref:hypothetical protein n=1 Tax=Halovivax sp. TaxID=1935978 RepID=UPI0031B892D3